MESLITVIIPVYNHAAAFRRSWRSLMAQVYRPLEVIIIDDGSSDDIESALREAKEELAGKADSSKVTLQIIKQKNQGAAAARNRGWQEARKGEFVIFWDADTLAPRDMLAKMKKQLDESPVAAYAYASYRFGWKIMKSQPFAADRLKRVNYIDTTALIRSEVLMDLARPFDETLQRFQDWDLWLTLLEQEKKGIFTPDLLYTKIVHGRKGYSQWLPKWVYYLPWKTKKVYAYEAAREIVLRKHHLFSASG